MVMKSKTDRYVIGRGEYTAPVSVVWKSKSGHYESEFGDTEDYSSTSIEDTLYPSGYLASSHECLNEITYETNPRHSDGTFSWNECTHLRWGLDPVRELRNNPWKIGMTTTPSLAQLAGNNNSLGSIQCYPDYPNGRRYYRHESCQAIGEAPLLLTTNDVFNPLSRMNEQFAPSLTIDECRGLTLDSFVASLFPDQFEEYQLYLRQQEAEFAKKADLNQLLNTESLFYSNLIQLVPIGRLIAGMSKVQKAAMLLSGLRSRFAKRPFREAIREAVRLDLFNRFVIQTTISDVADFLASFRDVWQLFEEGHARNARPWTRLAHRSPWLTLSSESYRRENIKFTIPGPNLGSGIQASEQRYRLQAWVYDTHWTVTPSKSGGRLTNNDKDPLGYTTLSNAMNDCLTAGLRGSSIANMEWALSGRIRREYFRWVCVRYKSLGALSPLKVWANRVGITKPLDSAWDLIPFSFVCDYFFRLGDWINAISQDLASFSELRGDIIKTTPVWVGDKWEIGHRVSMTNWDATAAREKAEEYGILSENLHLPPASHTYAIASLYRRHPVTKMGESSRLGLVSDKALSSTQKRTLAELAFSFMDKRLRMGEETADQMSAALAQLKLKSKDWRPKRNAAIDGMSADQFSDYVKRTLKQAATTIKVTSARTRK